MADSAIVPYILLLALAHSESLRLFKQLLPAPFVTLRTWLRHPSTPLRGAAQDVRQQGTFPLFVRGLCVRPAGRTHKPRTEEGVMPGFADRPPGTPWVPAFVAVAAGFSPAAGWRTTRTAGLKPAARRTKPFGLATHRAKPCITSPRYDQLAACH